jgi:hypothetical protein
VKPYFVSYVYWKENNFGFGHCQLLIKNSVIGFDDIQAIVSELRRLNPTFIDVVILNWRKFEEPE